MKALMAALHSLQLASLQRRSGRYVEVGERAIIRSSTYILEGRARLNIFKDPPFSILKLCHFCRLVYFEIEIIVICCGAYVRFWRYADTPTCPLFVRFQRQSGHLMLKNSACGRCGAEKPHSFLMMSSSKLGTQKD